MSCSYKKMFPKHFLKHLCFHLSVMVLLFSKWPHMKCNDKDFQTFKMEITEGHRRLILNIVTKIRHLKVRSITAWRS